MGNREIHQCECRECQGGNEVIRKQHENLNLLMSRLDEQQRRWMAAFAVAAIVRWFERKDRPRFADETKILILSDSGGSNGYRVRNWKYQLQQHLADRFQIEVMVCHYPSGASAWVWVMDGEPV
jgi:Rhodopirellula transposase DDE domain